MFYVLEGRWRCGSATARSRPVPAVLPASRPVSCTPSATKATVRFACSLQHAGGFENYVRGSGPPTPEVIARVASQFDCEFMS